MNDNGVIRKLQAVVDTQAERIRQLEDEIGLRAQLEIPADWRLTGSEHRVMRGLVQREICSKEFLLGFVYPVTADCPEPKIIDVFICKIRKKIRGREFNGAPLWIDTLWGRGFRLNPEARAYFGKKATGVDHVVAA